MLAHDDDNRGARGRLVSLPALSDGLPGVTRQDIAHAVLDALERVATPQEYYRINHIPPEEIAGLSLVLAEWLSRRGILVE